MNKEENKGETVTLYIVRKFINNSYWEYSVSMNQPPIEVTSKDFKMYNMTKEEFTALKPGIIAGGMNHLAEHLWLKVTKIEADKNRQEQEEKNLKEYNSILWRYSK